MIIKEAALKKSKINVGILHSPLPSVWDHSGTAQCMADPYIIHLQTGWMKCLPLLFAFMGHNTPYHFIWGKDYRDQGWSAVWLDAEIQPEEVWCLMAEPSITTKISQPCLMLPLREKIKTLPVSYLHFHVKCSNHILEILSSCNLILETRSPSIPSTPSQMM